MNIVFEPNSSTSNTYVKIITKELHKLNINTYSLSTILKSPKLFLTTSIIHLNWFENVGGHNYLRSLYGFSKKISKLIILIIFGKKIVWTFHNKKPHDKNNSFLSRYLMQLLAKRSHSIVIHSKDSLDLIREYYGNDVSKKTFYVPHPNYVIAYGPRITSEPSKESTKLSLLFMGAVKPYKNIEILIDAIKSFDSKDVDLTIMGKPYSIEYGQMLTSYVSEMKNVKLNLQFIKDEDIPLSLAEYDLLVLPYDINSSLNSGSAILAFSYGKTVICPKIGTITDYDNTEDILSYQYDTNKDHPIELRNIISDALYKKKKDRNVLRKMGENMFRQVGNQNDPVSVANSLKHIYSR